MFSLSIWWSALLIEEHEIGPDALENVIGGLAAMLSECIGRDVALSKFEYIGIAPFMCLSNDGVWTALATCRSARFPEVRVIARDQLF